MSDEDCVEIDYVNWKGEQSTRVIRPREFYFGPNKWHPGNQWLLDATDIAKDDIRTFAMKDIHGWRPVPVDETILCVAAVIWDNEGRILLLKHGAYCSFPGTWCLPGGGVKVGETLFKACQRETSEETGLEVIGTRFLVVTETLGPPHLIGMVFEAEIGEGDVHNAEPETHDAIGWFAMDRLPSPLMPGVIQWLIQTKQAWKTEECP
jgi:8-oxo-dGTP diphosphatase